ncbi:hypothetical protein M422DRAFT_143340, partial [Sphaerobolus stellatus SS14]
MTPYEAAFSTKPNLSGVREWGEKCYVRVEGGNKLGGRVREGRWLGIDERSKGFRIYWADTKAVTTERNVYYDRSAMPPSRLEGEDWEFIEAKSNSPAVPNNPQSQDPVSIPSTDIPIPSTPIPADISTPPEPTSRTEAAQPEEAPEVIPELPKRIRKPSKKVQDILDGKGRTSAKPADPKLPPGVQPPSVELEELKRQETQVFEGEGMSDWMMAGDWIEEYAMAAEISEVEALEPRSLGEAKARPDW